MKEFEVFQDVAALPVTTDACLFGSWIEKQLSIYLQENPTANILDIGTGTGLLCFMLAQKHQYIKLMGIDIHQPSLENAKQSLAFNQQKFPKYKNIEFFNQDFTTTNQFANNQFHAIISNPPFFQNQLESSNSTRNIARHSNELTPEILIAQSAQLLTENGQFFLLYPYSEFQSIVDILKKYFVLIQTVNIQPTPNKNPHLVFFHAEKSSNKNTNKSDAFCVYREPGIISDNSVSLLKDYYITL